MSIFNIIFYRFSSYCNVLDNRYHFLTNTKIKLISSTFQFNDTNHIQFIPFSKMTNELYNKSSAYVTYIYKYIYMYVHSSCGGSSPPFLKHSPLDPAWPPFFKIFVSSPLFFIPFLFKVFQTVPTTLTQPPPALI